MKTPTEVSAKPTRRRFSAKYKKRILARGPRETPGRPCTPPARAHPGVAQ